MITLSNGYSFECCVGSGALAFDCLGWIWERPLVALGLLKPELATVFIKTLTLESRKGNLCWWKPWECVRLIPGGSVNKVGLTNGGIDWWCDKVAPKIDFHRYRVAGSIYGTKKELIKMAKRLNDYPFVALEVNPSCPNTGHGLSTAEIVIDMVKVVVEVSRHPIIVKVSAAQDYLAIAEGLKGIAEAISINSVPWEMVFPGVRSPLWRLEKKVGGGGGGVSGRPAQHHNWKAVAELSAQGALPVIAPSIMDYEDIETVEKLGAKAFSFGAIHLGDYPVWLKPWSVFTNPCKPTLFVQRRNKEKGK